MEQSFDLDKLKANPKNPRRMSNHDARSLSQSMDKFGDLSSIVFNTRTGQLVGGHQRIETLKRLDGKKQVQITQRFDPKTDDGTTALGYVIYNKKPFPYREVEWDEGFELAANIAANRIQGEFDSDLLAEVTYMINELDADLLALTGQTDDEINKLLSQSGVTDEDGETLKERNVIEVDCIDETQMQSLYNELNERGIKCRILTL